MYGMLQYVWYMIDYDMYDMLLYIYYEMLRLASHSKYISM